MKSEEIRSDLLGEDRYIRGREVDSKIRDALYKKSIGYDLTEVVEEYNADGELTKRKVSTKHIPPDTSAMKMYLEEGARESEIVRLTDEQLASEKIRLLKLLREVEESENS